MISLAYFVDYLFSLSSLPDKQIAEQLSDPKQVVEMLAKKSILISKGNYLKPERLTLLEQWQVEEMLKRLSVLETGKLRSIISHQPVVIEFLIGFELWNIKNGHPFGYRVKRHYGVKKRGRKPDKT